MAHSGVLTAFPEVPDSPLWDVCAGPHRSHPIAGLSFAPNRRGQITIGGQEYAISTERGRQGLLTIAAVAADGQRSELATCQAPGGRARVLRSDPAHAEVERSVQLFPPSARWTWRTTGIDRLVGDPIVVQPNGFWRRTAQLRADIRGDLPSLPRTDSVLLLTMLWLFLARHGGPAASLGDAVSAL